MIRSSNMDVVLGQPIGGSSLGRCSAFSKARIQNIPGNEHYNIPKNCFFSDEPYKLERSKEEGEELYYTCVGDYPLSEECLIIHYFSEVGCTLVFG
jgi:hypothetical protein